VFQVQNLQNFNESKYVTTEDSAVTYTVAYLGGLAPAPFGVRIFFRRFITNKLKIYEFMLC